MALLYLPLSIVLYLHLYTILKKKQANGRYIIFWYRISIPWDIFHTAVLYWQVQPLQLVEKLHHKRDHTSFVREKMNPLDAVCLKCPRSYSFIVGYKHITSYFYIPRNSNQICIYSKYEHRFILILYPQISSDYLAINGFTWVFSPKNHHGFASFLLTTYELMQEQEPEIHFQPEKKRM